MIDGVLTNTLAALGYFLVLLSTQSPLFAQVLNALEPKAEIQSVNELHKEFSQRDISIKYPTHQKAIVGAQIVQEEPVDYKTGQVVSVPPRALYSGNYDDVYREAGEKYGVPWQILYGLHLTESGQRDGVIANVHGSGAQGPMQFMPGTWQAYGVDGNGDGIVDINNAVDAIFAAANFVSKHGGVREGLLSYGGNTAGTIAAARSKGLDITL